MLLTERMKTKGIDFRNPANIKKLAIVAAAIVIIVAAGIMYISGEDESAKSVTVVRDDGVSDEKGIENEAEGAEAETVASGKEASPARIYVDVSGAVNKPMVIEMCEGDRVFEAVEAAGGLREDADTRYVNQAALLNDGDRVYIPTAAEVANDAALPDFAGMSDVNAASGAGMTSDGKVNINTADSDSLQQLNGVGPSTAQKILDYRAQNGKFATIEEIQNVSGIGAKTFEKMREKITV